MADASNARDGILSADEEAEHDMLVDRDGPARTIGVVPPPAATSLAAAMLVEPSAGPARPPPAVVRNTNGQRATKQQRLFEKQPEAVGPQRIHEPIPEAAGDDVWDQEHELALEAGVLEDIAQRNVVQMDGPAHTLQRMAIAGKSNRAAKGIQPWARGSGRDDVHVHHVRLSEPKLRALDGSTTVTTESGDVVKYAPLKYGTTVLEYGKGAGKQDVVHDQIRDGPNRARLVPLQQA